MDVADSLNDSLNDSIKLSSQQSSCDNAGVCGGSIDQNNRTKALTEAAATTEINTSSSSSSSSSSAAAVEVPQPKKINASKLTRSNFYFGATLGEGSYARVVHAKMKPSIQGLETVQLEYAIKIMEKSHIVKENKVKYVMMERKILNGIRHPFIIRMHFSFQDTRYLYMCMDLVHGGELLSLILKCKEEKENQGKQFEACDITLTRFYSAEIIEALQYLHSKNIIHRDLKPENIIITSNGHIKVADFGTAYNGDDVESSSLEKFVGTAEYVTPELLKCDIEDEFTALGGGQSQESDDEQEEVDDNVVVSKACDLWALGCIIYQMLHGKTPFRAGTEYLIFEKIKSYAKGHSTLQYCNTIVEEASKDIIEALLKRNPDERLGVGEEGSSLGYNALKAHAFFANSKWGDELVDSQSPYIPDSGSFPKTDNMVDGDTDEWDLEEEVSPIMNNEFPAIKMKGIILSKKPDPSWTQYLQKGELQIFNGPVWKRKGFMSKKRQLILTSTPRLIYIDPDSMDLKGEIPWTADQPVVCTIINNTAFDIKCTSTGRSYHIIDASEAGSQMWVDLINAMLLKQREQVAANLLTNTAA